MDTITERGETVMDEQAVRQFVEEFAQHHDWCEARCPGTDEHGAHRTGKTCTCGFDAAKAKAFGEVR